MTAITTYSESGWDAPRGTYDGYRHNRQVPSRFYHASDPDDGTEPPFPPRIARNRVERRAPPPRQLTNQILALVPHAQREDPPVNKDYSPLPTQLLIVTITNATLAAVKPTLVKRRTITACNRRPPTDRTLSYENRATPLNFSENNGPHARYHQRTVLKPRRAVHTGWRIASLRKHGLTNRLRSYVHS